MSDKYVFSVTFPEYNNKDNTWDVTTYRHPDLDGNVKKFPNERDAEDYYWNVVKQMSAAWEGE